MELVLGKGKGKIMREKKVGFLDDYLFPEHISNACCPY